MILGTQALLSVLAQTPADTGNTDAYLVASLVLGALGIVLLFIEIFVPSGGMLAILTGIAFIGSVVSMFLWSPIAGLVLLLVYAGSVPIVGPLLIKLWTKSPIVRRYTLNDGASRVVTEFEHDEKSSDGSAPLSEGFDPLDPDAAQSARDSLRARRLRDLAALIGERGTAETSLRPSGFVMLGSRRVDAAAESGLIEAGTPVRVVAVLDGVLKVRAEP
ncbi:MAG: NfeD family protein [Phycisphaerae bacterium]|nr:NfeD family protein [Phycisphaerae bacterium]